MNESEIEERGHGVIEGKLPEGGGAELGLEGPGPTRVRTCLTWLIPLKCYVPQLLSFQVRPKPLTVETKCSPGAFLKREK